MKINLITISLVLLTSIVTYAQNTLPSTGFVGIGTSNPTKQLEVIGDTELGRVRINDTLTVEKPVRLKDSVIIENKLRVDKDVKILGSTVMVDNVKAKSNLKILGTTKMMGNGFVEGAFKFKGLADITNTEDRILTIGPNGVVDSWVRQDWLDAVYDLSLIHI